MTSPAGDTARLEPRSGRDRGVRVRTGFHPPTRQCATSPNQVAAVDEAKERAVLPSPVQLTTTGPAARVCRPR